MNLMIQRLRATKLFSLLSPQQLETLITASVSREAKAGQLINELDEPLIHHLVLTDGQMLITHEWTDDSGAQKSHERILDGDEATTKIAVFSSAGKGISIKALTDCRYLLVDGDKVDELLGWNQQYSRVSRNDTQLDHRMRTVKRVNIFLKLPAENVEEAFERMVPRVVREGETIVTQGEKGDSYYLIEEGQAQVWKTDPFTDETACVATLGPGDSFGEEALLQKGMRNATVKMITPGTLLVLAQSDFDDLVQPSMIEEVEAQTAHRLVESGKAGLVDCRYDMEFEESRIPGARWIPLDLIREGVDQLDPDFQYIVYCRSGRRSKAAAFLLRERNINALSLAGGIRDWPYEVDSEPIG